MAPKKPGAKAVGRGRVVKPLSKSATNSRLNSLFPNASAKSKVTQPILPDDDFEDLPSAVVRRMHQDARVHGYTLICIGPGSLSSSLFFFPNESPQRPFNTASHRFYKTAHRVAQSS